MSGHNWDGFEEMTGEEFAGAILAHRLPEEPVEIEVQDHTGALVFTGLSFLRVTVGTDHDRTGGYQWNRITARAEKSTSARTLDMIPAAKVPVGSAQPWWSDGGGVFRTLTFRHPDPTEEGNILLYFDNNPVPVVYPPDAMLAVFPPPSWRGGQS